MDYSENYATYTPSSSYSEDDTFYQRDEPEHPPSRPVFQFTGGSSQKNKQVRPQPSACAKGKESATSKARGGRQQGTTDFGEDATIELLKIADNLLPIRDDEWDAVQIEYNKFAKSSGLLERDSCSLRKKFDELIDMAIDKPIEEANRSQLLRMTLQIDDKLRIKSGTAFLMDNDSFEEAGVPDKRKVIHLTSDGDSAEEEPPKMAKRSRKSRTSMSQVAEAMASIGAYFSPDCVREREDTRARNSVPFLQLQLALTELREIQSRNERLSDALHAETCRTDKLDMQNADLKDKFKELRAKFEKLEDKVERVKADNRELKADLRSMQRRRKRHESESDEESGCQVAW